MALDKNDTRINKYTHGVVPAFSESLPLYIQSELSKLQAVLDAIRIMTPQVADNEPSNPVNGMIRFAKAPWDPLGTGSDVWVYWDQGTTSWAAL